MSYEFYIEIKGSKQGEFPDETDSGQDDRKRLIGLAFDHELIGLHHTSQAQRQRTGMQNTLWFVKPWGAASPGVFKALIDNEVLPLVRFEFVRPAAPGGEEIFRTIQLSGARIVGVEQFIEGPADLAPDQPQELERISLSFVKMEIEHFPGTTIIQPPSIPQPRPRPSGQPSTPAPGSAGTQMPLASDMQAWQTQAMMHEVSQTYGFIANMAKAMQETVMSMIKNIR